MFQNPADLDAVPGVGKSLIQEIRPYLQFPDEEK